DAVRLYPDREALLQDDLVLTFRELDGRCDRVASWLVRSGVRPGERVALCFPNDVRYAECLFGTIRAGAVAVPLNVRQSDEVLAYVVENADAVGILAHPAAVDR